MVDKNLPRALLVLFLSLVIRIAFSADAFGQNVSGINGIAPVIGVMQFDPGTAVNIDVSGFPDIATIDERGFTSTGSGFEANRNDLQFSSDGGVSPRLFATDEAFDVSADITLQVGSAAPAKEAGFRVDQAGFDGIFFVNTETSEIAALGTVLPFFNFNAVYGISYQAGQTANLRMRYSPPTMTGQVQSPGTMEYIVDLGLGPITSSPLPFSNPEGGVLPGSVVAAYEQATGSPNDPEDFVTTTFANFDFHANALQPESDFDADGDIDGSDFLIWQRGVGLTNSATRAQGDSDNDRDVDDADLVNWKTLFGASESSAVVRNIPEPATGLLGIALLAFSLTHPPVCKFPCRTCRSE